MGATFWREALCPGGTDVHNCCLEEVRAPSGTAESVLFPQVMSGAVSGQSPEVRSGYGRWNDAGNDRHGRHAMSQPA
jgi:hypothetical protein